MEGASSKFAYWPIFKHFSNLHICMKRSVRKTADTWHQDKSDECMIPAGRRKHTLNFTLSMSGILHVSTFRKLLCLFKNI